MPRSKVKYSPIDRIIEYNAEQWGLFKNIRNFAKNIASPLQKADFQYLIYGSVARGDINPLSDLDIVILNKLSSFKIEFALEKADLQIIGKQIVQATPGDAIKGHLFLPNSVTISFFMTNMNDIALDFYRFGGAIDKIGLQNDARVPGITKSLTLIIPNQSGHREMSLIGNEALARKLMVVQPKIITIRKRVLLRRDKTGRTGVFLKKDLSLNQNFEEELKKIADTNVIVRRRLMK
ncbi:MAG: nucleotidyltransferase domain-containing protein [Candidatus Lokiarchaeota archaeon]|nr:nucleotidyltransferase domain-containing protein [Candidatus Lokiarchaeota archaeon]